MQRIRRRQLAVREAAVDVDVAPIALEAANCDPLKQGCQTHFHRGSHVRPGCLQGAAYILHLQTIRRFVKIW